MAKLFQRKEKKEEKTRDSGLPKGMRALTPEEQKKADKMKINMTREELRNVFRATGMSEEKVMEAFPDPLPEAEQKEKLLELRRLFSAKKYDEVIRVFQPISVRGLLSGDIEDECHFALGFSGMMLKDKELIEMYGDAAIGYMLRSTTKENMPQVLGTIQYLMKLSEQEVPGCMRDRAGKLYPALVNILGEDHEFTREVKGYMNA